MDKHGEVSRLPFYIKEGDRMSLTLRKIVDMADKRVPNTDTDAEKVEFLDQLQRQLYRKIEIPEKTEKISTTVDISLYTLPSYIVPNRIKSVTITDSDGLNPVNYEYRGDGQEVVYNCYYIINGENSNTLGIYPTPTETGYMLINFMDSPNTLDSGDMNTVPRFFDDYQMVFVYKLASELAKLQRDIDLANNYEAEYSTLLKDAIKEINYEPSAMQVKTVW